MVSSTGTKDRRNIAFAASLVCMTCAGTLYLFSAYAQGLKQKRGLSQTALNGIASCGGFGQYLSGPIWGRLSDTHDRRVLCGTAGILLLTGYLSLAIGYSSELVPIAGLAIAYACVGLGSSGVFNSALATSVKNFDQREHGFAVGVPVAFFGLSAFVFSQLQRLFVTTTLESNNSSGVDIFGFLVFIGIVTGGGALIGSQFLYDVSGSVRRGERTEISTSGSGDEDETVGPVATAAINTEESLLLTVSPNAAAQSAPVEPSIFEQRDAWLLFGAFILLSGTGLMYINNVGAVVIALSSASDLPTDIQAMQRLHVGLLSICNCAGRISTGLASDFLMTRLKLTRLVGLIAGGGLIALALLVGIFGVGAGGVHSLVTVTLLLGLGYGAIFSAAPAIVGRWFGVERFGANWGWYQWAPALVLSNL
ncbi:UNVERIFIED_CONTAM: hypothetical protein HDU68_004091 [Siphonaria sp. JEL0065]|nr:hypothetical protein HDU68_004091 [Siphonaria sp. JEL0065]